jgi:hypothetical protein
LLTVLPREAIALTATWVITIAKNEESFCTTRPVFAALCRTGQTDWTRAALTEQQLIRKNKYDKIWWLSKKIEIGPFILRSSIILILCYCGWRSLLKKSDVLTASAASELRTARSSFCNTKDSHFIQNSVTESSYGRNDNKRSTGDGDEKKSVHCFSIEDFEVAWISVKHRDLLLGFLCLLL